MEDLFWIVLLWPYALAAALLWGLGFILRYFMIGWFAGDYRLVRRTKGYRAKHSTSETDQSTD